MINTVQTILAAIALIALLYVAFIAGAVILRAALVRFSAISITVYAIGIAAGLAIGFDLAGRT